jgi:hypothetical protein
MFLLKEDIDLLFEDVDVYVDSSMEMIQEYHKDILINIALFEEFTVSLLNEDKTEDKDHSRLIQNAQSIQNKLKKLDADDPNRHELEKSLTDLLGKLEQGTKDERISDDMKMFNTATRKIMKDLDYDNIKFKDYVNVRDPKKLNPLMGFLKKVWHWLSKVVFAVLSGIINAFRAMLDKKPINIERIISKGLKESQAIDILDSRKDLKVTDLGLIKLYEQNAQLTINEDNSLTEAPSSTKFVVVDVSKQIFELNVAIDHFFKLFDNAFGTNGEHLYDDSDLLALSKLIKITVKNVEKGQLFPTENEFGDVRLEHGISRDKAKQNLNNTKVNTDKLRSAYLNTANIIQNLLQTIATKQAQTTTSLASMSLFNKMTNKQLKALAKKVTPRLKQAEKMYKNLNKMITKFKKISSKISEKQFNIQKLAAVSFTTPDVRLLQDYFQTVRMLIQTTDLRMSALAIYIKEMRDIQGALEMFTPEHSASILKSIGRAVKQKSEILKRASV